MRRFMKTALVSLLLVGLLVPVGSWADTEDDIEEINDRLDAIELKSAKHKVSFFGDFRVRYDYMKWNLPAYNQFVGMDFTNPMAPMPVYMPVPEQKLENSEAWSARLRLKMEAKISKSLKFTGRLNMHRGFGASSVPLFNGFPNTVLTAFNSSAVPTGDLLRVERAAFTWDPASTPLFLTAGRQAATGGPPRELRENRMRQATPAAIMIDAQIDGLMLGWHLGSIGLPDEGILRFCYGTGYESGFGSGGNTGTTIVTTYVPDVTDPNNPSMIAMPNVIGDLKDSKVAGLCGESPIPAIPGNTLFTFGYFRLINMIDIPYGVTRGFPNGMSTQPQVVTATANLGDMDLVGLGFQHAADINEYELDWFAHYAANISHPDKGSASLYGFGPLLGDDSKSLNGWAVFAGVRGDIPGTNGGKLGLEYNHGSKNWFSYTPAADDVNAKLATRGDVFEGYYIQPLSKSLDFRVGYQAYMYDYAFSGWHISPAPIENFKLDSSPFLPYPYPDRIDNIYAVLDLNF